MAIKGHGPGKMPWRAAPGPWAVGCRPLPQTKQLLKSKPSCHTLQIMTKIQSLTILNKISSWDQQIKSVRFRWLSWA